MYQIKKFSDCWAVYNLESETSRSLTDHEKEKIAKEFPYLTDSQTASYFTDKITCLEDLP